MLLKIAPGDFVSLRAGVMARADERQKLERLCRYVSRPAVSGKRLSLTANGQVRYQLMSWAQRLMRVFGIDIKICPICGGALRIISCIEDPIVIEKILTHLDEKAPDP